MVRGRFAASAVELIDRNPALVAGFFLSGIAAPLPRRPIPAPAWRPVLRLGMLKFGCFWLSYP